MENFLTDTKITVVSGAQADGTGTISGAILDMSGFEGVAWIAKFDDVDDGAVLTLQAQQSASNSAGGMATLVGNASYTAGASDADDDVLVMDLCKPLKRYVRPQLVIASANATLATIIAIQYRAKKLPTTQGSTVLDSALLVSPDEA